MLVLELLALVVVAALAYAAAWIAWCLGVAFNVALAVGCLAFAVILAVAEIGLWFWHLVRPPAQQVLRNSLRFREARLARAVHIVRLQRGEPPSKGDPLS